MANPQKENGYTAIANEILKELLKIPLTGAEYKIILFVIRQTYGYHKKEDNISITQFEQNCKLSRQTTINCLKRLVKANILVKVDKPYINRYSFQKNYDKWVVKATRLVKTNRQTSQSRLTKTSQNQYTHKRNKEIIQKKGILKNWKPLKTPR